MEFAVVVVGSFIIIGVISSCYSVTVSQLKRQIKDLEEHYKEQRASDKAKLEKIQEVLDE